MPLGSARRAHHKSRTGCTTCKSKKVKCDEQHPCSYCVKRKLSCSLAPPTLTPVASSGASRDSRTPEVGFRTDERPSFTFSDFGLYRHFSKSTALAQADDSSTIIVWREIITDLATQYPYLLHEILGIAALHLRSAVPERAKQLERIAAEHQAQALPLFREALSSITPETAIPLFACSCLFIPYHFAAAKDASSLLFNEDTGTLAEWIVLIQGCAAITMQYHEAIMRSSLRSLLGDLRTPKVEDLSNGPSDAMLVDLGSKLPIVPEKREAYAKTMVKLRVCFYLSDQADTPMDRKNAALRFPPLMEQTFREDLEAKHPAALIIMSFWCVLLYRVESRWWLAGRVKPLLSMIEELVPVDVRSLMVWPMEEVGIYSKTIRFS
ncbi:hypothetical protein M426DRAFT_118734 [Hypoxylon sp. CI-4A]|nr:hypothetical protein M426DRAFT_118734 [Hypoxylon sp. CI-4A]